MKEYQRHSLNVFTWVLCALLCWSCASGEKGEDEESRPAREEEPVRVAANSRIEIYDESFDLLAASEPVEVLAEGFTWAEGPLWLADYNMLIFSDVPNNVIHAWRKTSGLSDYLRPSGFTGSETTSPEPGSNGLLLDRDGRLVLCQHGDRRIARMNTSLEHPGALFGTLADTYNGRRLNSPNDAAMFRDGSIYFTDPPYGLNGQDESPEKRLMFNGVYRLHPDGKVELLIDSLTRPNGVAFSPDYSTMYITQSDESNPVYLAYELDDEGRLKEGRIFYDASKLVPGHQGFPDGLKVHPDGYIFATGPGGILVFSSEGALVARIFTGQATANCAFDDRQMYLYMTADSYLLRVRMSKTSR